MKSSSQIETKILMKIYLISSIFLIFISAAKLSFRQIVFSYSIKLKHEKKIKIFFINRNRSFTNI